MLKYNVSQLLQEGTGARRRYRVEEADYALTEAEVTPFLTGEVDFLRTRQGILVTAALVAERVEMVCARCLEPAFVDLEIRFQETFYPTVEVFTGEPLGLPEGEELEDPFRIDEHHILDLTEAVRQYTILSLPRRPLCREDCRGLCPVCGQNLNQGSCSCQVEEVDPRWAALDEIWKALGEGS